MSLFAIGCYTRHPSLDVSGKGVVIVDWDEDSDERRIVGTGNEIVNPSYLHWDTAARRLYAVSEVDNRMGAVAAYRVSGSGELSWLGQEPGRGRSACHILVLPDIRRICTASYSDGRLTSYLLTPEGVGPVVMSRPYTGSGPDRERQASSHAHQVSLGPGGRYLYVCDLGSDAVWMHRLDAVDDETVPPARALEVPPGYGPRHLAWDPILPAAYIQCELQARLLVVSVDSDTGLMRLEAEYETAAPGDMEISAPAAVKVHPSGRSVAVSNRFDDTIAVFSIDRREAAGGGPVPTLSFADRFSCGGAAPRDIGFSRSGSRLFIANQDSSLVTCRYFDGETGLPVPGWAPPLETGTPVCVVMLD